MAFEAHRYFDLEEWLLDSAPDLAPILKKLKTVPPVPPKHDESEGQRQQKYISLLSGCLTNYEICLAGKDIDMRRYFEHAMRNTSNSDHAKEDHYGTEIGGAWNVENFIIRSGIVLNLGALEEFERGVLRILCARVALPKKAARKQKLFYPRLNDYLQTSPAWEKAEKARTTQTVGGRRALFEKYDIDSNSNDEWNVRIKKMRQDRNTIAHGNQALRHPFKDFIQLHYDLFHFVRFISVQTHLIHRIAL